MYSNSQSYISEDLSEYVVTWSTFNDTESVVEFGTDILTLDSSASGSSVLFIDGGDEQREQWMHKVSLSGLSDNTQYCE